MTDPNIVFVGGRMVADPELRTTGGKGTPVTNFAICNSESIGEGERKSNFIDVVAFGKIAETITKFFHKGHYILLEGRIEQSRWQDSEGNNRSKVQIRAHQFHFSPLNPKGKNDNTIAEETTQENSMPF